MKRTLPYLVFTALCTIDVLTAPAQNLGITTPGTTAYPATNIGNTQTSSPGSTGGNTLTFDQFTTTVPLTAIAIRTFGTVSSGTNNIKVAIYSDNGSNLPGTLLFPAVAATVTANNVSTITIPNTYLTPGKYWFAFNMNSSSSSANYITRSSGITGAVRKFTNFNSFPFSTAFPSNAATLSLTNGAAGTQDMIYFVGVPVEGYAKATKATLSATGVFSSVSFYTHAAGNVRLAIYSDNGSGTAPSAKQWESADIAINGTGQPKLTTVNISAGSPASLTLNAGTYWLAWQWNTVTTGPSYKAGAANTGNAIIQSYGAFPSSWTGGTGSTENWTIYATYCAQPTASVTGQTNITCYAANDGTITVAASGGVSPYLFSIDNGATYSSATSGNTRLFTGLLPNTAYRIKVKDNVGCVSQ